MRTLPTFVMLLVAASLGAAEAYRWVDKDGVVHYSDKLVPGAEKIPLVSAPKPGSVPQVYSPTAQAPREPDTRLLTCKISSPAPEQTFGIEDTVPVLIETEPALAAGDQLTVTLNGARIEGWPTGGTSYQFAGLPRGAYTLLAVISAPDGRAKCTTAPLAFNVFQPSLLSPGRRAAPR